MHVAVVWNVFGGNAQIVNDRFRTQFNEGLLLTSFLDGLSFLSLPRSHLVNSAEQLLGSPIDLGRRHRTISCHCSPGIDMVLVDTGIPNLARHYDILKILIIYTIIRMNIYTVPREFNSSRPLIAASSLSSDAMKPRRFTIVTA